MEWLDIVDINDKVVGKETRDVIHAKGHLHRSTHIVLNNSKGEVFVQLRSKNKDVGAGLWDTSAAGHVDSGESYLQCAVRELEEELGVILEQAALEFIIQLQPEERTGFEFTQVFRVVSDQAIVLQSEEVDDGRWLAPQALSQWIEESPEQFTDVFKLIWPTFAASPPAP